MREERIVLSREALEAFRIWKECGGYQYGPHTETYAIREVDWPKFIAALEARAKPPQGDVGADSGLAAADDNHKGVLASFTIKVRQDGTDVHSRVENLVRPEFALWTAIGALAQESASLGSCPFAHKIMLLPDLVTVAKWRAATVLPPEVSEALNTVLRAANDKSPIADDNHKALVEAASRGHRALDSLRGKYDTGAVADQLKAALAAFQSRQEEK